MSKFYAGIGSRQTPPEVLDLMARVAVKLEADGWTLRSGGAGGADKAFASKVSDVQVFVPWHGFNGVMDGILGVDANTLRTAQDFHPAWDRCSQGARKLHARNVRQVYGVNPDGSDDSRFVMCWTPDAARVGGTATAMRLAAAKDIPVYNLADAETRTRIEAYLAE